MVAGLSQKTIAKRLKVSTAAVSFWETGQTMPAPNRVPDLARVFGVPPAVIVEAFAPTAAA